MIRVIVKLLLLSWAVTAKKTDEFEKQEGPRSVAPKREILNFYLPDTSLPHKKNEFPGFLRQTHKSRISFNATEKSYINETNIINPAGILENDALVPDDSEELKAEVTLLFKKIEECRNNLNNQTFSLKPYSSLLRLESETFKATLRYCNISGKLVDKLKGKLSQLEVFQKIFVLIPKNNSFESPDHEKNTQESTPPASRIYSHRSIETTGVENNLKLKLGDEWIHIEPKVSHMSHIYLGSSVYPILTEESRVLDKEHTLPSLTSTERSFTKESPVSSDWTNGFLSLFQRAPKSKRYHQLEELIFQQDGNLKPVLRLARNLEGKTLKYPGTKAAVEATAVDHKLSTKVAQKLNFLPRTSFRWKIRKNNDDLFLRKEETKCLMDLKKFAEDPRYKVINRLCTIILEHFRKFLNAGLWRQKIKSHD